MRHIAKTVTGMPATDGAGVKLKRVIGTPALDLIDPFLMLDEFGSDDPASWIAGFPDHPHRGFETVTIMLDGRVKHADSVGNQGVIEAGDVQWMTAGRGIIHSEMPERADGRLRGFQLWVNLPGKLKMHAPRYQDVPAARIASVARDGATVRVIAGEAFGTQGAASTLIPVRLLDLALAPAGPLRDRGAGCARLLHLCLRRRSARARPQRKAARSVQGHARGAGRRRWRDAFEPAAPARKSCSPTANRSANRSPATAPSS